MVNVAIIGATGYGGAELLRLLHQHKGANVCSIHSSSQAGTPISDIYPHLTDVCPLVLEDIDPEKIAEKADVVFLATPSGISASLTPELMKHDIKIIDLSGDFRLKEPELYKKWYKKTPAPKENLQEAVYGLPEWFADEIKEAKVLANPGCYPTATLLGLAPLAREGLIQENSIVVDAKSGVSGAGKTPTAVAHFPEMNDNFRIYKVNEHQHIPEIEQLLTTWNKNIQPISFSTHLLPITRGIMATIYANAKEETSIQQLLELYKTAYQDAPFVRIRKQGSYPSTKEVYGTNYCDIGVAYDERTGRVMIVSVIDNLVKGAAGQAIQNFNIMTGFAETEGLYSYPLYP